MQPLGKFEVISNKLIIADPAHNYDKRSEPSGKLPYIDVENRIWYAYTTKSGKKIKELFVVTDPAIITECDDLTWEFETNIDVDTGQAGFFDLHHYRSDTSTSNYSLTSGFDIVNEGDKWYSMCCEITLNSKESAGVIPYGVVSNSGLGNGRYNVYV